MKPASILFIAIASVWGGRATFSLPSQAQTPWSQIGRAVQQGERVRGARLQGTALPVDLRTGKALAADYAAKLNIAFSLPGKYSKMKDGFYVTLFEGFDGDQPFHRQSFKNGARGNSSTAVSSDFLSYQRADLARLLIGEFGILDTQLNLSAIQEGVSSFKVTGAEGFECSVDVTADGVPIRVRYKGTVSLVSEVNGATVSLPPEPAEVVMTFSERRLVGSTLIAHRILTELVSRRNSQRQFFDDTHFDSVIINPVFGPDDFRR